MLLFESLDSDTMDRTIQPVSITGDDSTFSNDLNSFMDHSWSNFYAGQKRLSRFPSQIQTGKDYTVSFTGTPAKSFRFTLDSVASEGVKIKIPYNSAGAYTVFANGVEMPYTEWDSSSNKPGSLTETAGCGENRYVGVENFLEFYLTPGCNIVIEPQDAIYVNVRLDWTLEEFYGAGGVTAFQDRMAAVLGVHASQIKVVAVYYGNNSANGRRLSGSQGLIIDFEVISLPESEGGQTLNEMNHDIQTKLADDSSVLNVATNKLEVNEHGRLLIDNIVQDNNYPETEEDEDFDALDSAKPANLTAEEPASPAYESSEMSNDAAMNMMIALFTIVTASISLFAYCAVRKCGQKGTNTYAASSATSE